MVKLKLVKNIDPVPAILETDATGKVAEIYADIRATLGVPVVNLIWRHLATIDGGLDFAWNMLKPVYVSGEVAAQANALNHQLGIPVLPGLNQSTLDAAGLSAEDLVTHAILWPWARYWPNLIISPTILDCR